MLDDSAVDRLVRDLASPDPVVRDDGAATAVGAALAQGDLDAPHRRRLGDAACALLTHPRAEARSFGALTLAMLGAHEPPREAWVDALLAWYPTEPDQRGWDDDLGWVHAVAHGADALGAWGVTRAVAPTRLLEAVADRLTTPSDAVWRDQEDDRLACATALVLSRCEDEQVATTWLAPVVELLADGEPGPVPGHVSNALRTLRGLYVTLDQQPLQDGAPLAVPHAAAVRGALAAALEPPTAWAWRRA
ncbi:DUF2785 domain-containing protein [Lapillicoccus jejuensis]|uniref:Uncharacterized protein DUF2785 n=1 Tax=Lapillicoccus jejuensis TaxID=402171 RepID=A0A542DWM0_9MICO|nr:DUF2785 domain-containing protein [Lapillicoccus jejuensis]TQJ07491.1 uncharacterized protein DUF2785 [Lapillicoccus jejuensis]